MITFKTISTAMIACFVVILAGCQSTGGLGGNGQVDSRLADNQDVEFFNKSGWEACAGGAAIGALACAVSNSGNKAVCMAAAAVAGCGIGIGTNAYLDNQRKKYASKEQQLNASIKDVQTENNRIQSATTAAQTVIASDKQTLAQLNKDIAAKTVDKEKMQQKVKGIDANIAFLRNTITDMKKHEKQWEDVSADMKKRDTNTTQLDGEIAQMHLKINGLQEQLDSLYSQRTALKVG